VAKGLQRVVDKEPRLRMLFSDLGKEFYNKHVTQEILIPNNIKLYSTFSNIKASQAERLGRFVRERLERHYLHTGKSNWIDVIETIEKVYNTTKHSRTLIAPNDVNRSNEMEIAARLFPKLRPTLPKFDVGQMVRLLKSVNLFAKKTKAQFTDEIFKIYKIKLSNPPTYFLKDKNGEIVLGGVYFEELSPVTVKSASSKVKILTYRNRRGHRYLKLSSENRTPHWESVIEFNKKVRKGLYEIITNNE
jgi:hypothetical protein